MRPDLSVLTMRTRKIPCSSPSGRTRESFLICTRGLRSRRLGALGRHRSLVRRTLPQLTTGKLAQLIAQFGLQTELDQHAQKYCPHERCFYYAALYDALAGVLLLKALVTRPEVSSASLAWLLQLAPQTQKNGQIFAKRNCFSLRAARRRRAAPSVTRKAIHCEHADECGVG